LKKNDVLTAVQDLLHRIASLMYFCMPIFGVIISVSAAAARANFVVNSGVFV